MPSNNFNTIKNVQCYLHTCNCFKMVVHWVIKKSNQTTIDLAIQLPNECFTERDYLNYRYFIKRNLYMCHLCLQLIESKKYNKDI